MDRCWSLSEYVVTIFIAFSFTVDSWFFFNSDSSDLYPKHVFGIPLSVRHFSRHSLTLHIDLHQMLAVPFLE